MTTHTPEQQNPALRQGFEGEAEAVGLSERRDAYVPPGAESLNGTSRNSTAEDAATVNAPQADTALDALFQQDVAARWVRRYIDLCIPLIPCQRKAGDTKASKTPVSGWSWSKNVITTLPEAAKHFLGDKLNIAARLDNHLDLDFDWREAAALASVTPLNNLQAFGRAGSPDSHRFGRLKEGETIKSRKYVLPQSLEVHPKVGGEHAMCVAEIRYGSGHYTVMPGSVHGTGERIEPGARLLKEDPDKFTLESMSASDVERFMNITVFASFCAHFFPGVGARCDYMMAVAGALQHAEVQPNNVQAIVQRIGDYNGDSGERGQWRIGAERGAARVESGEEVTGIPTIVKILGMGEDVADWLRELLGAGTEQLVLGENDPDLLRLNAKHAVIEDTSGKCMVLNETVNPTLKYKAVSYSSFEAFAQRYSHIKKRLGKGRNGEPIEKQLGSWWLGNKRRRQYEQVAFLPGRSEESIYNLWPGFTVAPDPDHPHRKIRKFLAHIRVNICQRNPALYKYVIRWMAQAVQRPGVPGRVALVLLGRMGVGKGMFARTFGRLFGRCFVPVVQGKHVTGNFNAHMGECIVFFADECFFAGNKEHEQVLKTITTEPTWPIERKRFDPIISASCLHIIMATNSDWAVPVDQDDRRYCCIRVGGEQMQNGAYFEAIKAEMDDGGLAALLASCSR